MYYWLCKPIIPELYNLKQWLVELSSFAVEIRYPGIESTKEEAEESLNTAINARNIIRKHLNLDID
jgi:hypothetical protein